MNQGLMVLVALVVGWFAVGSIWNVRKGNAALRWLRGGLKQVGERSTVRWLGTTAVEMKIAKARAPFEDAAVVLFLEPRDVPWIWGPSRLRGRRDTLILRARLRKPPALDVELLDLASWSGREVLPQLLSEAWSTREPAAPGELAAYFKVDGALPLGDALLSRARQGGMSVRRLSLRRREPHLQLHVDLPVPSTSAAEFFDAVRALGEAARA